MQMVSNILINLIILVYIQYLDIHSCIIHAKSVILKKNNPLKVESNPK